MPTNTLMFNPLAPIVQNGVSREMSAPNGYYDQAFDYVYTVQLTGNQELLGQFIPIYTYADFAWRALVTTVITGQYGIKFTDAQGYYLSNNYINSTALLCTPADPFCWPAEILIPAGGRLLFDIIDLSGSTNNIQIVFRGANRFAL